MLETILVSGAYDVHHYYIRKSRHVLVFCVHTLAHTYVSAYWCYLYDICIVYGICTYLPYPIICMYIPVCTTSQKSARLIFLPSLGMPTGIQRVIVNTLHCSSRIIKYCSFSIIIPSASVYLPSWTAQKLMSIRLQGNW
jgi:hypothetical protein